MGVFDGFSSDLLHERDGYCGRGTDVEANKRIFGVLIEKLLPPFLVREVILSGEGRGTKDPATATLDFSLIDPDHRGVNKEIELDDASVDMAIVVHD